MYEVIRVTASNAFMMMIDEPLMRKLFRALGLSELALRSNAIRVINPIRIVH